MKEAIATGGPHFVPPYRPDTGGVDFLGMRQVNLDMMQHCIPGINNVTWYVRPFALLSWIYWKFHALATTAGIQKPTKKQIEVWREKVETLFTWGHKLNAVMRVPGTSAEPPGKGRVPLDFKSWKRTAVNTSLMAAVQYGPSAKTFDGLGFLDPYGPFLRTVGEGISLAVALDEQIRKADRSRLLSDLDPRLATAQHAQDLFRSWSVLALSARERTAFRRAFFDPNAIGGTDAYGRRSTTLGLILRLLQDADKPLTVSEIRSGLFHQRTRRGRTRITEEHFQATLILWIVLQVRQAQRLAMEGLLCWLESRLCYHDERVTDVLVSSTMKALSESEGRFPHRGVIGAIYATLQRGCTDLDELLDRSEANSNYNVFELMTRILESVDTGADDLPAFCLRILFLCAQFCEALRGCKGAEPWLERGHAERLSLSHWTNTICDCRDSNLPEFLRLLFENLILSQHFSVAARRFDGRTQRLRISIEQDGLEFLAQKPLVPKVTGDRLETALALMADCGLLRWNDSTGRYEAA